MSVTITPTVGRKVYFFVDDNQLEPHDATIIKVHAPHWQANPFTLVNLAVTDPEGEQSVHYSVPCSPSPVPYPHFRWMDYQLGQAAKQSEMGNVEACYATVSGFAEKSLRGG